MGGKKAPGAKPLTVALFQISSSPRHVHEGRVLPSRTPLRGGHAPPLREQVGQLTLESKVLRATDTPLLKAWRPSSIARCLPLRLRLIVAAGRVVRQTARARQASKAEATPVDHPRVAARASQHAPRATMESR